jgi:hypothetical protein
MKSLHDADKIWSRQTTNLAAQQFHNSWSDCWIVLKFLQEFMDLIVDKISLIDTDGV